MQMLKKSLDNILSEKFEVARISVIQTLETLTLSYENLSLQEDSSKRVAKQV